MKVVQINTVCDSDSTGKICAGVSHILNSYGIENYIIYTLGDSENPQGIKCSERFPKLQALRSKVFGNYGFNAKKTTRCIINELERIKPDIVHLHNLHSHNVQLEVLFSYFKTKKIKIFWTFHDCWAFTGYCVYYDMVECVKWKDSCRNCPQKNRYSWIFDRSHEIFEKKKMIFSGLDMTIITPSEWLKDQVKQSFLKDYPVETLNNGIDLNIFQPRKSDFRKNHQIKENKFIILGVASKWVLRKGLDVFINLAQRLDDKFQIVLVGTDDEVNKRLPSNIISIHRTANQIELAQIYSAADLFVNPTREEVFGLVNVEANACGTPVITFKTGGSTECIDDTSGCVVERNDEDGLYKAIIEIEKTRPFSVENCRKRANYFSNEDRYQKYVELYKKCK